MFEYERENVLSKIPGYDPSYVIEYYNDWSTYEENAYLFILSKDGLLYSLLHNSSVMSDDNSEKWELETVSEEDAIKEMLAFDKASKWVETFMDYCR